MVSVHQTKVIFEIEHEFYEIWKKSGAKGLRVSTSATDRQCHLVHRSSNKTNIQT